MKAIENAAAWLIRPENRPKDIPQPEHPYAIVMAYAALLDALAVLAGAEGSGNKLRELHAARLAAEEVRVGRKESAQIRIAIHELHHLLLMMRKEHLVPSDIADVLKWSVARSIRRLADGDEEPKEAKSLESVDAQWLAQRCAAWCGELKGEKKGRPGTVTIVREWAERAGIWGKPEGLKTKLRDALKKKRKGGMSGPP